MQFRSKLLLLTSTVLLSAFLFSEELLIGDANFQPEEHLEEPEDKSGGEVQMVQYQPPRVGVFVGAFKAETTQKVGRARAVVTSHPTAAASRVYSLSVTLLGIRGRRPWSKHQADQDLVLRGMDILGNGSVMALGQVRKEQEWLSNRVASKEGGQRWCRLEAFLESFDGGSSQAKVLHPENRSHIVAEVVSPDCSFSLHLDLEKVDLELLSRKVLNYGVLMNTLTLLQLRSFLSQMRHHEEEHATVAKLSALGIAMQALMDAYDSFLHLSVAAPVQVVTEADDGMPDFSRLTASRRPILIRHLLTHTSGISCGLAPTLDGPKQRTARERAWADIYAPLVNRVDRGEIKDLAQWVNELAQLPLISHPGTHYSYGYSYDILGHLVELKSGQKLENYLHEHIFKPLGMCDTSFQLPGGPSSKRLGVLYRYTKSRLWGSDGKRFRLVRVDPKKGTPSRWAKCKVPSAGGGLSSLEGGLLSTMDDYAKFLLAVTSGGQHCGVRILSESSAEMMMSDLSSLLGTRVPSSARPYDDAGLGLSGIGELQRRGAPSWGGWFDGVSGVRQWGGAASCAFKFDPNKGRPILVMVMTQALPQDDGTTITTLLRDVREVIQTEK